MKLKKKKLCPYPIPHRKLWVPGVFMLALGAGFAFWAGRQPANWLIADESAPAEEHDLTENQEITPDVTAPVVTVPVKKQQLLDAREEKRDQEILRASSFHMASVFPKGLESSDPSESYGGQVYKDLMEKDSRWISGIYGISKTSPRELAASIGTSADFLPEEWCKIIVSFYDGDGTPISGYSNAADILSLSSVYSFYHDPENGESFTSYAEELWKSSHSYKISIGNVYYCDGPCQFSSLKEEEFGDEELTADSLEELAEEGESLAEVEMEVESTEISETAEISDDLAAAETSESHAPEEASEETAEEPPPSSMSLAAEAIGLSEDELEALLKQSGPAGYAAYLESVSMEEIGTETDSQNPNGPGKNLCKGHVDLHVTASIIGIDEERQNLFSIDPVGNSEDAITEIWSGWTWLPRLYAKSLKMQDWFENYGLSHSSSMYILNPLTASEINYYMRMLPDGTSSQRTDVIRQALLSVGTIPYYWGGKPSAPGFDGNGFGTITSPDQKGRSLRGLDCSGWINWVFWSALGERLSAESTSGLSNCGRPIQRSELQPGDLIIRTGDSAHVYLFLSWAQDGSMYVIHETGGITNNVTVSKTNVDWPYYRSLFH